MSPCATIISLRLLVAPYAVYWMRLLILISRLSPSAILIDFEVDGALFLMLFFRVFFSSQKRITVTRYTGISSWTRICLIRLFPFIQSGLRDWKRVVIIWPKEEVPLPVPLLLQSAVVRRKLCYIQGRHQKPKSTSLLCRNPWIVIKNVSLVAFFNFFPRIMSVRLL